MKFLKMLTLILALSMMLLSAVACTGDSGAGESTTETPGNDATSESEEGTQAPFFSTITVYGLDADGNQTEIIEEVEDVAYNGLRATDALTVFDVITDYCDDNDIPYTTDDEGKIVSIGDCTTENGGYVWKYTVDGKHLTDYSTILTSGSTIVATFEAVEG